MDRESDSPLVDRALLAALDEALGAVAAAIPWAERDSKRVIWHEGSSATPAWVPTWATGVCELFEACAEIEMADVGNGWFVHPLESGPPDDPFVPREVARSGPCFPLGTDGGGGWFVVGDDGVVWRLPPGLLRDGVYDPAPDQPVEHVAPSVRGFVELMHALAVEASTRDDGSSGGAESDDEVLSSAHSGRGHHPRRGGRRPFEHLRHLVVLPVGDLSCQLSRHRAGATRAERPVPVTMRR